jgi:hypothetical protein
MPPKKKKASKAIRVRRGLTTKPKVVKYTDFKCRGLIRILIREPTKDSSRWNVFPEFALYPMNLRADILKDAGFKQESKGKWVLRTNKFNIFVYV